MKSSTNDVIFAVEQWSFSCCQLTPVAGAHLASGNVRMVNRVGKVPQCALVFAASRADAGLPFGGVKTSGDGRESGDIGIPQFANKRQVGIFAADAPAIAAVMVRESQVTAGEPA